MATFFCPLPVTTKAWIDDKIYFEAKRQHFYHYISGKMMDGLNFDNSEQDRSCFAKVLLAMNFSFISVNIQTYLYVS